MAKKLLHDEHLTLDSNRIHILSEVRDDFEVWLNTDVGEFDGLCIGCGVTREGAIADALDILRQGVSALGKAARVSTTAETGD